MLWYKFSLKTMTTDLSSFLNFYYIQCPTSTCSQKKFSFVKCLNNKRMKPRGLILWATTIFLSLFQYKVELLGFSSVGSSLIFLAGGCPSWSWFDCWGRVDITSICGACLSTEELNWSISLSVSWSVSRSVSQSS